MIILGEIHDNPEHHRNQARAIASFQPTAVVFEMLSPAQIAGISPEDKGDPATLAASLRWEESGWPDFDLYWPVFAAAGGLPIYGAALPRDVVRSAVFDGAAKPFGADATLYGLDQALDAAEQAEREAGQMEAHCDAMPEEMLPGMVAAQRLRDAAFARTVIAAHAETGGPVVLITGNGHARTDWGVPRYLRRAAPELTIWSLGQLEARPDGPQPFDAWLVTDPAERDDPCAAFR